MPAAKATPVFPWPTSLCPRLRASCPARRASFPTRLQACPVRRAGRPELRAGCPPRLHRRPQRRARRPARLHGCPGRRAAFPEPWHACPERLHACPTRRAGVQTRIHGHFSAENRTSRAWILTYHPVFRKGYENRKVFSDLHKGWDTKRDTPSDILGASFSHSTGGTKPKQNNKNERIVYAQYHP